MPSVSGSSAADIRTDRLQAQLSIFDESDQVGLIKKIITRLCGRWTKSSTNLGQRASSAERRTMAGANVGGGEQTLAGAVYRSYENELRNLNAMDFDDLLVSAVSASWPNERSPREMAREAAHLVVDEFQDTNRLQLELINQLAGDPPPNIAVVGDDDQMHLWLARCGGVEHPGI